MNIKTKKIISFLKKTKNPEDIIKILDNAVTSQCNETNEWWNWELNDFIDRIFIKTKHSTPVEKNVILSYVEQFVLFLENKYLDLDKENRTLEMFSSLVYASLCFSKYYNKNKGATYIFRRIFTDERFIADWLVNDESELDSNFLITETRSDKFLFLKNILETGIDDFTLRRYGHKQGSGKNLVIFLMIDKLIKEYDVFVGLHRRLEELRTAAMLPLSNEDFKWLVKTGRTEFLYKTDHAFYAGKYHGADENMKPVEGWNYLLDSTNPKEISWCIKYPMKDVVAKNELPLDKTILGKIFKHKQCQYVLYTDPNYSYAIPDMIEYASKRKYHNSLCVEFKDILGYLDE